MDWLNVVCKWRTLFAGWQLGTGPKGEPESDAVRDHREVTILLRVEASAFARLLVVKGVCTRAEILATFYDEARELTQLYEKRFPGIRATIDGLEFYDMEQATATMRGWKP